MLLGVDRLLISDGARLVLFLPLLVIVLYGLAQSFTNSNPQWWVKHVEDAAGGLSMSTGIYVMSLLMLVADITLLLILLRLANLSQGMTIWPDGDGTICKSFVPGDHSIL